MLNFLRKLRRNNMNGKYLKYAIGEIVLVVVGILIALGINNWNEERKESINERILLEKLRVEHDYNLSTLYSDTTFMKEAIKSISSVYFNLKEPEPESDSIIAENINAVLRASLLEFSTEYLNRYISNSQLTNDELVSALIELKDAFSTLELSGTLAYEYRLEKVISWLENSLDFYDASISDINRLRDMTFVNRLIILESIEAGRSESFEACMQQSVLVDSLLNVRLTE